MRLIPCLLCAALVLVGCAHRKPAPVPPARPIITPDLRPLGRVETVNLPARFVVVSFSHGAMPALNQTLGVYHAGLKTAEIKITGPQKEINIVAEIVTGAPQAQDEVKPD